MRILLAQSSALLIAPPALLITPALLTEAALAPVLAAPFVGSLLGVLIRRLPAGRPVVWARSACEACDRPLGAAELIPIVSFVALRGRCRTCRAPIAATHIAIELAAVLVPCALLAAGVGSPGLLWTGSALGWVLLALGWIDLASFLLPDVLTLPLLVAGLVVCQWQSPQALADHAIAAVVAYLLFRGTELLYRRMRGRDGLGQGDAKLIAAGAAWTGLAALPGILLGAALLGLLLAGLAVLRGKPVGATTRLPFGPPLAFAIWALWIAQHRGAAPEWPFG